MSTRPTVKSSVPTSTIDFRSEFTSSPAVIAAQHDEAVNTILSRLDQLQAKINGEGSGEVGTGTTTAKKTSGTTSVVRTTSPTTTVTSGELHARLSSLESIHEGALNRLSSKLGEVEKRLADNSNAEHLMGKIVSKFSTLETRLQSHAGLGDRVKRLEAHLESDPMQEEMLHRINSKLDKIEDMQMMKKSLRSTPTEPTRRVDSSTEKEIRGLQDRLAALKELRSKYDRE